MTTAQALLTTLEQRGVMVWVEEGQLHYRAPVGVMTTDDRTTLAAVKGDMIRLLSGSTGGTRSGVWGSGG